jgi:hypothetical protein
MNTREMSWRRAGRFRHSSFRPALSWRPEWAHHRRCTHRNQIFNAKSLLGRFAAASRTKIWHYVSTIPGLSSVRAITKEQRAEAKLEIATLKLLRLLDQRVRAGNGKRHIPLRMYVTTCLEENDGCGKLFAKCRIDQDYCSRTCVNRAQVRRFRRNRGGKKPRSGD